SRAMDLVLTGRAVGAAEALEIGLVNRVVPDGTALTAAIELATEISRFPQECMRRDRLSLLEQEGLDEEAAIRNEYDHGVVSLQAGAVAGAARFADGAGRHGSFGPAQGTEETGS
ncbi:enoyl-CoA hydratase-related protein, partial [Dietzia sp. DQ11-38-2]|uniref:enoyl-CoA hydratase-related protein n=1 Tax=Dietzia sp. DQ11-38-2 TaxID=2711155 RepID=UPI001F5065BC